MRVYPASHPAAQRRAPYCPAPVGLVKDVRAGLSQPGQKRLPSRWLYDEVGSALFEAICLLPEYGLTRADARILEIHAAEIARRARGPLRVAELGSGSARKSRPLLAALAGQRPLTYVPIDISRAALTRCEAEMASLPRLTVGPVEAEYLEGLFCAAAARKEGERLLVLFLGSTIGNFDRPEAVEFLVEVRRLLDPGDMFLLGTDLLKPVPELLAAYDDAAGVTAAFNLNLLARLNRELEANFDLPRFVHEARWDERERRIEMHLRSLEAQSVDIPGARLRIDLREGESLWTESSHKFAPDEPARLARRAGFRVVETWSDGEWPFAETLIVAKDAWSP
jgi:L-histidine Nalpha-methyltransferase